MTWAYDIAAFERDLEVHTNSVCNWPGWERMIPFAGKQSLLAKGNKREDGIQRSTKSTLNCKLHQHWLDVFF